MPSLQNCEKCFIVFNQKHNTKTTVFGGVKLKFLIFSISVFVRGERSDSRSGRFTLAKSFRYDLDRDWFVPGNRLEIVGYRKMHCQSQELIHNPVPSSLSNHYTTWATAFLPFNLYSLQQQNVSALYSNTRDALHPSIWTQTPWPSKFHIVINWNANLVQLGNFIDVFLARHVSGKTHCTMRTVHTAVKTTTHRKSRCRKPSAATQHLTLLMKGVCTRNK